ncbi:hypothetical protein ACOZ38_04385 [Sphaerisporangium viridialbum]|uniref:hypothetical protein n=1 Tax=Sphaerisporangium viridialbum TaxID=46189 RepID=UPI003C75F14C
MRSTRLMAAILAAAILGSVGGLAPAALAWAGPTSDQLAWAGPTSTQLAWAGPGSAHA